MKKILIKIMLPISALLFVLLMLQQKGRDFRIKKKKSQRLQHAM